MSIRIICINKDGGYHENPYVAITSLGWINEETYATGNYTRVEMHDWIKRGGVAYVKDSKGDIAYLVAEVSPWGTKYVKTKSDNTKADNLLSLPECK